MHPPRGAVVKRHSGLHSGDPRLFRVFLDVHWLRSSLLKKVMACSKTMLVLAKELGAYAHLCPRVQRGSQEQNVFCKCADNV